MSPPLVPSHDHDVHLVLCDFGDHGRAYVETDPAAADKDTIVRNMIAGQYDHPSCPHAHSGNSKLWLRKIVDRYPILLAVDLISHHDFWPPVSANFRCSTGWRKSMSGLEMLGVALTAAMLILGVWRYYAQ
jgi:hypothetical protein